MRSHIYAKSWVVGESVRMDRLDGDVQEEDLQGLECGRVVQW